MAIKLDGESSHQILVSGFEGRRLREAMAFGSSMRPLIKPGAGLELEPAPAAGIRLGDIISFESRPGLSVTHRVVKIFKKQEQTFFITKGDNRLDCDGPVAEKQILGRVIRVGRHPLRSIKWRVLGICVARISYGQSVLYRSLAQSRLNRCRHRLEEKGIFPRIGIRSWFMRFSNPMSGLLPFQSALHDFRAWLLRFQLSWQGIEIQRWSAKETEGMAEVWN